MKLKIERTAFQQFLHRFQKGYYGPRKLGEAFYIEFNLQQYKDIDFKDIQLKNGAYAIKTIYHFTEFI